MHFLVPHLWPITLARNKRPFEYPIRVARWCCFDRNPWQHKTKKKTLGQHTTSGDER